MDVPQLIKAIDDTTVRLEQGDVKSDNERQQLVVAAKRLQNAAESPIDAVASISFDVSELCKYLLRICIYGCVWYPRI